MLIVDWGLTINQIPNAISITVEKVENNLKNYMTKDSAGCIPRLLTHDQKSARLISSRANVTWFEADSPGFP